MLNKFIIFLLLMIIIVTTYGHNSDDNERITRTKRAGGSGGFFDFLGSFAKLIGEQYQETKSTLNELNEIFRDTFSDTATTKKTILVAVPVDDTTNADSENSATTTEGTTTTEIYRISRYEVGRILGKNFRGLQKIKRIELQDALNQSKYSIQEYVEEFRKQVGHPAKKYPSKRIEIRKRDEILKDNSIT